MFASAAPQAVTVQAGPAQAAPKNLSLPVLRPDLERLPAPAEPGGAPAWTLYDPVSAAYLRVGWREMEVLQRLRRCRSLEALREDLQRHTAIRFSLEEVAAVIDGAIRAGITTRSLLRPAAALVEERNARRRGRGWAGLLSALFFRLPLVKPQRFLSATLDAVRWLGSVPMLAAFGVLWAVALLWTLQRWDDYASVLPDFFSWRGVLAYGAGLAGVRLVHELSHAYAAAAYGVRVATMGFVFCLLWPVPYCDVTDAWRLPQRRTRLLISAAGILSEIAVGGMALLGWNLLEPSSLRDLCFVLSSVTLASTLLVNLNPLMRYDGYYLLSDLVRVDNLQPRSQAWTRGWWRRVVLGLPVVEPEEGVSLWRAAGYVGYALAVWLYRLFFYAGIAWLLYTRTSAVKPVGAALFVFAMSAFLVVPLVHEAREVVGMGRKTGWPWRAKGFGIALLLAAVLLALPGRSRFSVSAVTENERVQTVAAPVAGRIVSHGLVRGGMVAAGAVLLEIVDDETETLVAQAREELALAEEQLRRVHAASDTRALAAESERAVTRARAAMQALEGRLEQGRVRAASGGVVREVDPLLRVGLPVKRDLKLAEVAAAGGTRILAYLPQRRAGEVVPHTAGTLYLSGASGQTVACRVRRVRDVREVWLRHPELAAVRGGDLSAVEVPGEGLQLQGVYYLAECDVDDPPTAQLAAGLTGTLWLEVQSSSYLVQGWRRLRDALIRESGF